MSNILIAPSILSADFAALGRAVKAIEHPHGADILHIDVMDGHYVPNLTIGPAVIAALKAQSKLFLEVHLMIANPADSIDQYIKAGSDRLVIHPETSIHLHRLCQYIRSQNKQVGLAINPAQDISVLGLDWVGHLLSSITVMSVNPGFPAQSFIPESLQKIQAIKHKLSELGLQDQIAIEVDGGINTQTIKSAVQAGADILVAGNAVFAGGADQAMHKIQELRTQCT